MWKKKCTFAAANCKVRNKTPHCGENEPNNEPQLRAAEEKHKNKNIINIKIL